MRVDKLCMQLLLLGTPRPDRPQLFISATLLLSVRTGSDQSENPTTPNKNSFCWAWLKQLIVRGCGLSDFLYVGVTYVEVGGTNRLERAPRTENPSIQCNP